MKKHIAGLAALLFCATPVQAQAQKTPAHKLLLISIDGLDWRYLRDREALGLKIPNLRRLLARSQVADGVTGVWPTVTWPSHTSLITGVPPAKHGILANAGGTAGHHPELLVRFQDQGAHPDANASPRRGAPQRRSTGR